MRRQGDRFYDDEDEESNASYGHYGPQRPLELLSSPDRQEGRPVTHTRLKRRPVMTAFVKGGTLYDGDQEASEGGGASSSTIEGRSDSCRKKRREEDDEKGAEGCPSLLYAELLARPTEESEVTVIEEVEVIEDKQGAGAAGLSAPRWKHQQHEDEDDDVIFIQDNSSRRTGATAAVASSQSGGFHCEVCKEYISSMDKASHERSTLHVFNARKTSTSSRILLPGSNRGVQMLARMGWKEDRGLGREEQGRVQPPKSILKLDRKGLGHKQPEARVTHFPSHDAEQAARAADGKSDAQRKEEEVERLRRLARDGGRSSGSVTVGSVERHETAKERQQRICKERQARERIQRELNSGEDMVGEKEEAMLRLPPGMIDGKTGKSKTLMELVREEEEEGVQDGSRASRSIWT